MKLLVPAKENAAELESSREARGEDRERGPHQSGAPVKSAKGAPSTASRGRRQTTASPVYRPGPAGKLENSPVSGLIEDAGTIRLSSSPDAAPSLPKGLLTVSTCDWITYSTAIFLHILLETVYYFTSTEMFRELAHVLTIQ